MYVQRLYTVYSKDDVRSPFVKPPWATPLAPGDFKPKITHTELGNNAADIGPSFFQQMAMAALVWMKLIKR
jgi:hypothetical protein